MLVKLLKIGSYLLVGVIITAALAYFVITGYVNRQLDARNDDTAYDSCHKIWAARGIYQRRKEGGIRQNSIESVSRAFAMGGHGVEIDTYYDPAADRFVVSHGNPMDEPQRKILTLEEMFAAVGTGGYFWLDYKNLRGLSDSQTEAAIKRLLAITAEGDLRQRIYIEGADPLTLPRYRAAGFNTLFDIHPPEDSWPVTRFVLNIYKAAFYFGNHSAMAMTYGELEAPVYGADTRRALGSIPVFLYHVPNDDALLQELVGTAAVRVILVGRDRSVGRFEINDCDGAAPAASE